jgi:hypothetical protein
VLLARQLQPTAATFRNPNYPVREQNSASVSAGLAEPGGGEGCRRSSACQMLRCFGMSPSHASHRYLGWHSSIDYAAHATLK